MTSDTIKMMLFIYKIFVFNQVLKDARRDGNFLAIEYVFAIQISNLVSYRHSSSLKKP